MMWRTKNYSHPCLPKDLKVLNKVFITNEMSEKDKQDLFSEFKNTMK